MPISSVSEFLRRLKKSPENFFIVHYSCQNLNDDNEALSPRITSIAVSHFSTEQSVSFSTHAIAEELGIAREDVFKRFDEIERELLNRFYNFAGERRACHWLHWNMRNSTYGFEHLEHRFRVLKGGDPPVVPVEQRINLNDMLAQRYGSGYASHPRMQSLMDLNGGRHRDFLDGQEEVKAFQDSDFMKMHMSTLSKVGFFHSVTKKMLAGKLRTNSNGVGAMLDRTLESRLAKGSSVMASGAGLIYAGTDLIPWLITLF